MTKSAVCTLSDGVTSFVIIMVSFGLDMRQKQCLLGKGDAVDTNGREKKVAVNVIQAELFEETKSSEAVGTK